MSVALKGAAKRLGRFRICTESNTQNITANP